jgi:hypothetical protein
VDKAALLDKIKNDALTPAGCPTHQQATLALQELAVLDQLKELDRNALTAAREELLQVVANYRRTLKSRRFFRKKRTRG